MHELDGSSSKASGAGAICCDGSSIISGSSDKSLHSGECLNTFHGHTDKVWFVAIFFDETKVFLHRQITA